MASAYETFKDLELTRDEVERFTDALKNKEFRKLLTEYVDDIRNPDNQKIYQQEITQLEKERGIDVTFINPEAGYVIKTSADGKKKAFINICSNEHVQKPLSTPAIENGSKGLHWTLPHSLAPPREDVDKKGVRCVVYDVVFHPDTLHLAQKNKAFREMVNSTACGAVESNFDVALDKKNLKFPKLQYKGYPHAAVIRKPTKEAPAPLSPEEKELMDKLYAHIDTKTDIPKKSKKAKKIDDDKSLYTTPTYVIKHRRSYEMEEFTEDKNSKLNTAIPKELVVEIALPLLKSSADIVLDVAEKSLDLISEKPAKYKLSLTLPYCVNQDNGNAKFDKDNKKLVVTLPVKNSRTLLLEKYDSGVDTDDSPLATSPLEEIDSKMETLTSFDAELETVTNKIEEYNFLDSNHYTLPEFTANVNENEHMVIFTIDVKNVDSTSVKKLINEYDFNVKFSTVSSGFYTVHYVLFIKLSGDFVIDATSVSTDIWNNNLTLQFQYKQECDTLKLTSFLYGLDENNLIERHFDTYLNNNTEFEVPAPVQPPVFKNFKYQKKQIREFKSRTTPIDISGTSESSGDEFSHSLSPGKGRGILKCMRSERRTVSESGVDDMRLAGSLDNNFTSVDSVIPEEGEISSSLKKTVRFSDVVSRKLYRSNSSILGQRKKNQRKAKAKKRAQERRHSESEVSETDEKKERDIETTDTMGSTKGTEDGGSPIESNFNSEIFELDIN